MIIGGGVMGLMTAHYAARTASAVTILERSWVGNPSTASFGLTRSIRHDYQDPEYARLAHEARKLWRGLEDQSPEPLLVDCGVLNIAKRTVTPDLERTWAARSLPVLEGLQLAGASLDGDRLRQRFPQFAADLGVLDVAAGFIYVPAVTGLLIRSLRAQGVRVRENVSVRDLARSNGVWRVTTDAETVSADSLVVTAGLAANEVLDHLAAPIRLPLRPARPAESKYFFPPPSVRHLFTERVLPAFAYLDIGIYGHPLYEGKTPGIKIGIYNPPDATLAPPPTGTQGQISSVAGFVSECLPALRGAEIVDVAAVNGTDSCCYDLVADDEFIIGPVPGLADVFVGAGWRGTGYKFAPWVGRVLAQLAMRGETAYEIARFTPARFMPQARAAGL